MLLSSLYSLMRILDEEFSAIPCASPPAVVGHAKPGEAEFHPGATCGSSTGWVQLLSICTTRLSSNSSRVSPHV